MEIEVGGDSSAIEKPDPVSLSDKMYEVNCVLVDTQKLLGEILGEGVLEDSDVSSPCGKIPALNMHIDFAGETACKILSMARRILSQL